VPPAGVVFDVNETLLDLRSLDDVFVEFGLDVGLRLTWFAQTLRDGFALTLAGRYLPFGELARINADAITPGLGEALLGAFAQLEPHEDVVEAVRLLAAAEIPLVTLSVGDAAIAQGAMRRVGIDQHFHSFLSCSQVAKWKPAAEPYLLGCAELGLAPRDVLMVASHSWDLAGAQAVGMRTAWIARGEAAPAPWLDESTEAFQGLRDCAAAMLN
jgi:2-haloacid dehalogenase